MNAGKNLWPSTARIRGTSLGSIDYTGRCSLAVRLQCNNLATTMQLAWHTSSLVGLDSSVRFLRAVAEFAVFTCAQGVCMPRPSLPEWLSASLCSFFHLFVDVGYHNYGI